MAVKISNRPHTTCAKVASHFDLVSLYLMGLGKCLLLHFRDGCIYGAQDRKTDCHSPEKLFSALFIFLFIYQQVKMWRDAWNCFIVFHLSSMCAPFCTYYPPFVCCSLFSVTLKAIPESTIDAKTSFTVIAFMYLFISDKSLALYLFKMFWITDRQTNSL